MAEMKEVDFKTYCPLCKYAYLHNEYDPCCDCQDIGGRIESSQPVSFTLSENVKKIDFETYCPKCEWYNSEPMLTTHIPCNECKSQRYSTVTDIPGLYTKKEVKNE